jgi:hypothetical protein
VIIILFLKFKLKKMNNNNKNKFKFKNIKISLPSISSIHFKTKQNQKNKELFSSQYSSLPNEQKSNNNNNKENIENKEEFGYELNESSDNNIKNDIVDNNILPSYINEKSNGEKIDISENNNQLTNNKNNKKKLTSIPITKINNNRKDKINKKIIKNYNKINTINNKNNSDINNYTSYNSSNNNGFIEQKVKYIEVDNDWNMQKLNFDGISAVSKGNSYDNNFNENLNAIDNNYFISSKESNNTLIKSDNFDKNSNNNFKSLCIGKDNLNKKDVSLSQQFSKITPNIIKNKVIKTNNGTYNNNNSYKEEDDNKDTINDVVINLKKQQYLEEQLQNEKKLNKEKDNYIEILKQAINSKLIDNSSKELNKNKYDLIIESTKHKLENEKIKKSVIIQKIITDEMQKDLENYKNEKNKLEEELLRYKNNYNTNEQKIKEYEIKLNEMKNNLNKQKKLCMNLQTEINSLKQKNDDLIEINEKISKDKCVVNIEEKSLEDYKNIIQEKNNVIKELKNENINLIKEIDTIKNNENICYTNLSDNNLYEQIEKLNNKIKNKESEINIMKVNENNHKKIINESYEIIKEITNNIKMHYNNNNKNDFFNQIQNGQIYVKTIKDYLDSVNTDNNGNILSLDSKLKTIKDFSNLIKMKLELLFNNFTFNNKKNDKSLEDNHKEKIKNNNLLNDLLISSNGHNNNINKNSIDNYNKISQKINRSNKKILNDDMIFKKIDITWNNNSSHNHIPENNRINKYKNKLTIHGHNLGLFNNAMNTQSDLLEKNSIIYKSNISPLNKDSLSINSKNIRLNMKYDNLVESILNDDQKKIKNNKLNLKVKELADLINNQDSYNYNKNNNKNMNIKDMKKSKNNLSEENEKANNTIGVFPSNKKIKNKSGNIHLSLANLNATRKSDNFDIFKSSTGGICNTNINSPHSNLPITLNFTLNNHKKTISSSNNYLNKKAHIEKLEQFNLKNSYNNLPNNRINISYAKTLESNTKSISSIRNERPFIKIIDDSTNLFEEINNKNSKNNKKKLAHKLLMKQKILSDKENINTIDINGLANEVMKPTFLKNNVSLTLNNNTDKAKDSAIFQEIKKMSLLNNK